MSVSELLPCPYCGDPMEWNHDVDGFMHTPRSADIGKCYLRHNYYHRGQLDWWNTRAMKAAEPLAQGDDRELMKGARDIPTPRSGGGMVAPNLKSTPVGGRAPADLFRWLDGDNRKCCCRGRAMAKEHIADLEQQIAALVRSPQGDEVARCSDCGNAHDPQIRCPNFHAGMMPTARAALVRSKPIDREALSLIHERIARLPPKDDRTEYAQGKYDVLIELGAALTTIGSQSIEGERGDA